MEVTTKIQSFKDLVAWQKGHVLVIKVYKLTKKWPREEVFGLTSQVRRAAVSITSNISEGFSRTTSKDKANFYSVALGSLTELQSQLLISKDLEYITQEEFITSSEDTILISKLINGLIKSTRSVFRP